MGLVRRDWDENFHGGGMAGWNEKLWRDAGLKKSMLDPHILALKTTVTDLN
mgnify:CR=1 FL=1